MGPIRGLAQKASGTLGRFMVCRFQVAGASGALEQKTEKQAPKAQAPGF